MAIVVRRLQARDAGRLVGCFERCYGRTYPNEVVYDEARLAALVSSGALRSVVAVDDAEIVGHTGLKVVSDVARVVEAGHTVVDPASRGRGVLAELSAALFTLCRDEGFAGFVHYPTTAHEIIQRTSVRFGGVETGLMLAYVPGDTDYVGVDMQDPGERIAATVVYQPVAELSEREVALPDRYAELLGGLYAQIGAPRRTRPGTAPRGSSSIETRHEPRRGLLRVIVGRAGEDLAERIAALPAEQASPVTQVDLPLEDSVSGDAVDALAAQGFLYCGLLPEFAAGDVLRLQRLTGQPPGAYAPRVANDGARALLARIERDRRGAA